MKRWFKANLGAGSFVTHAVGFLYARSETAAGGHCHIEWYASWLIVSFSGCCALSAVSTVSVFTFLSVCFVSYGKGRIWWQKFYAFRYCRVFGLVCGTFCLQPKPPGSSQILIASACGWRVCILRHEDWVMAGIMEILATNSVSL